MAVTKKAMGLPPGEEDGKLGPKMSALTEKQREFVRYLVERGDRDHTHCAKLAGYSANSANSLRVTAHHLFHDERIQEAIREESQRRLVGMLPLATRIVGDILASEDAKDENRLKAAGMVMDRGGMHQVQEQKHSLEFDVEQVKLLAALARTMNIPVEKLLGKRLAALAPPAIEAEFEETAESEPE